MSTAPAAGLVVVGGGVAATRAVETVRDEGHDGPVTVLAGEPRLPYDRPPLSKAVLKGEDEPDSTVLHDESWYAEHDVDVRLGQRASRLDVEAHRVFLAGGDELPYERLLLATGSRVQRLSVPGADLDGVVTLRTLEESVALRDRMATGPRVVVVGAGWIGLEAAAAARAHGCEVTVVSPVAPLARVLGDRLSRVFAALHRDNGVDLVLQTGVQSMRGTGRVEAVVTTDGRVLPADLVVVGVGVAPNTELAADAGLDLAEDLGGVVVDSSLRTTHPDVFAVGDIAAWPCRPLGDRRLRVEHWANAYDGGPVAGRGLLGQDATHDVLPFFWSDQYDVGMEYAGHVADPGSADLVTRGDLDGREFMAFWLVGGRVEAGMHVNVWDTIDDVQTLIRDRRQVDVRRLADADVPLTEV